MSFQDLRPYFQGRIAAADSDYQEWTDAFSEENIPDSLINKSYHLSYGDFNLSSGLQNGDFNYNGFVTLNVYFKGYAAPIDTIDSAWAKAQTIIQECCKHSQRLTQSNIKNILAQSVGVSPLGRSNDNIIRLTIVFNCKVIIAVS
jgi:hypothetical protein